MESAKGPLIIGAGPAGLTAALTLTKSGVTPRLFEETSHVGGLARTPRRADWRVDPGGHRFFTKDRDVLELWESLLPPDQWISVPRRSAMLVDGQYVQYPLVGRDLLTQMGYRQGVRGLSSLLRSRFTRDAQLADDSASFREWGTREFGRYWYDKFFDGYVRKTWLCDPNQITSGWANQRIRPIDWRPRKGAPATGQDEFQYPRLGPGQMWEAAAAALTNSGVVPSLNSRVVNIHFDRSTWTVELHNGQIASGDAIFSSMPLGLLIEALKPEPPQHIREVAKTLKHRALITVAVALRKRYDIPYNWVYTPGPDFRVGRVQNYGNWSSALTPESFEGTYLGLEYFIGANGELRPTSDQELATIVERDLCALGMADSEIEHVMIVQSEFAYPICDPTQEASVALIRDYLRRQYPTLHPIGRNGMHRYDNQDHAMLSAMQSVARYLGEDMDSWNVNTDRRYHESGLLKRL